MVETIFALKLISKYISNLPCWLSQAQRPRMFSHWPRLDEKRLGDRVWPDFGASFRRSFGAIMSCSDEEG